MSELKGQILGVLLVLMIFGSMAVAFSNIFANATSAVSSQVQENLV